MVRLYDFTVPIHNFQRHRTRVRRRLREIYRLSQDRMKQGYDIVLVARTRAVTANYHELERAYRRICEKLELWEKTL